MSDVANPYAAPAAPLENVTIDTAAEATRKAHISHEASIKAVGILYYIGGALVIVGALPQTPGNVGEKTAIMALLVAVGVAVIFAGRGVRTLRPWGRTLGCIVSGLGLLGFPIGTLINAYILYLFLSKKGRTIFSPEYRAVIAATPHVKYRTSIIVWIFLALVLAVIVIGIGVSVIGGR